jgi:predicted RNA binding protein YcfA (HicA-like mRNA interferase family)
MNKKEKLLTKAQSGAELSYGEFQTLLKQNGWEYVRQKGSHAAWKKGDSTVFIQPDGSGKAKKYQVSQFLEFQEACDD